MYKITYKLRHCHMENLGADGFVGHYSYTTHEEEFADLKEANETFSDMKEDEEISNIMRNF